MPTPSLFDQPAASAIFQEVPAERRTAFVDLLFITDRAPEPGPDAELPYGQERSRSLAFGSTRALRFCRQWIGMTCNVTA